MTSIRFDHFITYADTPSIDTYLDEYRSAGFLVAEETVGRPPDAPTDGPGGGLGVHRTPHRHQARTGRAASTEGRGAAGRAFVAMAGGVVGREGALKDAANQQGHGEWQAGTGADCRCLLLR